ncbi:MAG: metal ABC transporter substrate-binding protein [Actinomycetota bacterium]
MSRITKLLAALLAFTMLAAACGDDDTAASGDLPTVVVTTNILGDVVTELTGGAIEVVTIMPVGADPHDFQASAQQADAMRTADALIVNGSDFEEGLLDVIEGAESDGVLLYEAISAVSTIEVGEGGHDDHDDHEGEEGHDDHEGEEGHDDHEGHDHSGDDPHFFTDPARMAAAVDGIAAFLIANVEGIDADAVTEAAEAYHEELEALDAEVATLIDGIPAENRVLITNHEVFGYFADRYGFEVAGAIIPSGSTLDGTSAGDLAELAELITDEGVPAIFSDVSASDQLAQTLADEVGSSVAVVELFTESLGDSDSEGATYVDMVRTNATRIAEALAS